MGAESVIIPGSREVRAAVDTPGGVGCVVACPPHPRYGGNRRDPRLMTVARALGDRGLACVRFDYGPWDEGVAEREDAETVTAWAAERYERVGLFGYSFGGGIALLAASSRRVAAVSVLAPVAGVGGVDVVDAVGMIDEEVPVQVVYGERDTTVDAEAVVNAVRRRNGAVETVQADHFFVGAHAEIGGLVGGFFGQHLGGSS